MSVMKVFEKNFHDLIQSGVKTVSLIEDEEEIYTKSKTDWLPEKINALACSYCRVEFDGTNQQRDHYRSDWHRYNLKQSLRLRQPLSEEEFVDQSNKDDISSISGSDSEDEDTIDTIARTQGKVFLQNTSGNVFSVYTSLLAQKKDDLSENCIEKIGQFSNDTYWAVFMLGGGHFAGAIFKGDSAFVHKSFHCYTVRAGQGGSQSSQDNKSGGAHAKSAGATLRRSNEQALVQRVHSILETWSSDLGKCSLIFHRASGPYNRRVLFGGKPAVLNKEDPRLRSIPFTTRRPTFDEVKRVFGLLNQVYVYDSVDAAIDYFSRQKQQEQKSKRRISSASINRAKPREIPERRLMVPISSESSDDGIPFNLSLTTQEISFEDLQEYEDTAPKRKHTSSKKIWNKPVKTKKEINEEKRKDGIKEIISNGDVIGLTRLLDNLQNIDEVLDEQGNTLGHIAAIENEIEMVKFLLEKEVDLCAKNKRQETMYTCSKNPEIRGLLKDFARENPEKFNYNKAQIPTSVLTQNEMDEKKKAKRKIKKEKAKLKKKELDVKQKEYVEQEKFLKLSDREKRALAAERRILSQAGVVISRCFHCGNDMAGNVPFEYANNRFCTMDCLKKHRLANPTPLSC